ncbi:uncharacterized protein LOC126456125 [Schistocerca serialis cubense]|uniref:uncharacterized protein LOC126456125 n=1 Tax=Schistocerca serialis cubense TaxID=2023355 RepID=UPI00214F4E94|nr:uncharacterized protein LOC126456125 [Schistocerca serialis cubense]
MLQLSTTGSPAVDVQHFLYGSASEEVHRRQLAGLLTLFHGELQSTLRALGLAAEADAYPLDEFLEDMERTAPRYEDNEETQKKTLIVKTLLESGGFKDIVEKLDIFKTEVEMLHDMMPQIHEKLSALEKEEFRPLAAKCYQWGRQPVTSRVGGSHLASLATKYINGLANQLEKCPGYEQYSERYRTFANRFIDVKYERMEKMKKQTKLPVLTHGDCWKNNMMFKYMNEEVSEVRLVDFQCSSVTSPASDLLYFLYSSASENVHRHHMEDLLREYHSTLVGLLRRLGLEQQAEAYTFEELKKDMDHCLD